MNLQIHIFIFVGLLASSITGLPLSSDEILKFIPLPENFTGGMIDEIVGDDEIPDKDSSMAEDDDSTGMEKRVAIKNKLWHDGVVHYEFDDDLASDETKQSVFYGALKEWEQKTCVKFEPYNEASMGVYGDRLKIVTDSYGCASYVGRQGGQQRLWLSNGCWSHGTVLHEIGHALGMRHEQSRQDRATKINIIEANINPRAKHNFKMVGKNHHKPITPYDYLSIMQYSKTAFGLVENGRRKVTIETVDKCYQDLIGKARFLSHYDARLINHIYGCDKDCDDWTCDENCYETRNGNDPRCHLECLDNSNNECEGGYCFVGDIWPNWCAHMAKKYLPYVCKTDAQGCCETCREYYFKRNQK